MKRGKVKERERLQRTSKAAAVQAIREELGACGQLFVNNYAPETNVLITENTPPPHLAGSHHQVQLIKLDGAQAASAADRVEQSPSSHNDSLLATARRAPPTDTPTSLPSGSSSKMTAPVGQEIKSSAMSTNQPGTNTVQARPNVGLLKAQSPWLRKDGVCIAVFEDESVSELLIKGKSL